MASATTHHKQLTVSTSNTSAVQQQKPSPSSSKVAGSHPNQQALAALAGSPTSTTNGANCDPDVVRQLPEVIRHVLHGCVGTGSGYGTTERGAHLTVYVTSADPTGITEPNLPRLLLWLDNSTLNNDVTWYYMFISPASSTMALLDAINSSGVHAEIKALATSRGASLQILCDPWGPSSPAAAMTTTLMSSSSDDRIGRISLSNLNRKRNGTFLILWFIVLSIYTTYIYTLGFILLWLIVK